MKRLFTLVALAGALTAAACNDPQPQDQADIAAPEPAVEAPAAEDSAQDSVATTAPSAVDAAPAAPPADSTTLPSDKKTSAESVQPESETLFY